MNRTDRLLAIVLELQVRRHCRAEDLAASFETSKRTIYRDIQALCEAGVPIIAAPGQGYSIDEGYFLPPLSFTADEATLLLLGADLMVRSFDAEYRAAAQSAERKIQGVLPAHLRDRVRWLRDSLAFINPPELTPDETERLQQIRRAIARQQTVRFRYHTRHPALGSEAVNLRDADPYGLACVAGTWYMMGYCHLRRERRTFRLSRMDRLTVLPRTFERPADYRASAAPNQDDITLVVRLLFDGEAAPWVLEERYFYMTSAEPTPDGLLVTLHLRHTREILQWLLKWGRHVRVLEPDSLRETLAVEVRAMLDVHSRPSDHLPEQNFDQVESLLT